MEAFYGFQSLIGTFVTKSLAKGFKDFVFQSLIGTFVTDGKAKALVYDMISCFNPS